MNITAEELKLLKETYPNISDDVLNLSNPQLASRINLNAGVGAIVGHTEPIKRMNKYNVSAKEDRTYRGVTYDSQKEMNFYINMLEPMLKDGVLDYVLYHVRFPIGGNSYYESDFLALRKTNIEMPEGHSWIITLYEVKGMWTDMAKLKMKLFKEKYPNLILKII